MLSSHLTLGTRLTFVGGKGGVGKTTVAAALGVELADRGERTRVLSVDPAHSLGDALGVELGPDPRGVEGIPQLDALEVDAERERTRFLGQHGASIDLLIERGTYLDASDVHELTGLTLPGMDEMAALLSLSRLAEEFSGHLFVDTAPTGHTLRLLDLPRLALAWLEALEAMEAKHTAVASALAGRYPDDAATAFLRTLRTDLEGLSRLLHDPAATRFVLVTTTEPVVVAETLRFREYLERLGIALGGVVVNKQTGAATDAATGEGMVYVPSLPHDLRGPEGLRPFAASAAPRPGDALSSAQAATDSGIEVGGPFQPPLDRRLYFVVGKGGVGKTTAAAALAIRLAENRPGGVLLLSVDPAGSLDEVLGIDAGVEPVAVPGADALLAQQLDAEAAWSDFRSRYRSEVDQFFTGLVAGGMSADLDRQVVERLVDLAPPGVDELMALMEVIDLTEDRLYDAVVLDTAPTGHLLRLLEVPDVALDWAHALLRLLLKYREVTHLGGGLGERVLKLSRSLRTLREQLTDVATTYFLAVALPESLSVPETARLLPRLRRLGMSPGAMLVNRSLAPNGELLPGGIANTRRLLEIDTGVACAAAPALAPSPRTAEALREFIAGWREIRLGPDNVNAEG